MRIPFKYKIMITFVTVVLFFLLFIIVYNYNSVQKFTKNIIDKQLESNIELFKELVKTPMMVYDLATLDNMTERFANLPNVDNVILKDVNSKVISKFINHHNQKLNKTKEYIDNHKYIEFTIKNDETILGEGTVLFDISDVVMQINKHTQNIIIIAIVEIILSLLVSYLIGRILTRNLTVLDDAFKKVSSQNDKIVKVDIHSQDEFENIANSFYEMQIKLKDEIHKNIEKERQLIQQNRSASMGDMLSAIIHQWKQPLNTISVANSLIELDLQLSENKDSDNIIKNTQVVNKQIENMSKTMNDFRNFFKPQEKSLYDISTSVNTVYELIGGIYSNQNVNIKLELEDNIITSGYSNELSHVIINILNNARDIIVESNCEIRDIFVKSFIQNNKAVITITDCAGGVSDDLIDKIFDPYVTTKSDEKGTGVGLDMSKTIIEKVEGSITVKNIITTLYKKSYKGAQFKIELQLNS